MNITINPDAESQAAVQAAVDSYNASTGESLTLEQYVARVVEADFERAKSDAISTRAKALEAAARSLPDAKRQQFTTEATALLQQIAAS
tara:strand:- start:168 stop:434 length:267 start_codon:yes stop_codon:yes gene_type:complete